MKKRFLSVLLVFALIAGLFASLTTVSVATTEPTGDLPADAAIGVAEQYASDLWKQARNSGSVAPMVRLCFRYTVISDEIDPNTGAKKQTNYWLRIALADGQTKDLATAVPAEAAEYDSGVAKENQIHSDLFADLNAVGTVSMKDGELTFAGVSYNRTSTYGLIVCAPGALKVNITGGDLYANFSLQDSSANVYYHDMYATANCHLLITSDGHTLHGLDGGNQIRNSFGGVVFYGNVGFVSGNNPDYHDVVVDNLGGGYPIVFGGDLGGSLRVENTSVYGACVENRSGDIVFCGKGTYDIYSGGTGVEATYGLYIHAAAKKDSALKVLEDVSLNVTAQCGMAVNQKAPQTPGHDALLVDTSGTVVFTVPQKYTKTWTGSTVFVNSGSVHLTRGKIFFGMVSETFAGACAVTLNLNNADKHLKNRLVVDGTAEAAILGVSNTGGSSRMVPLWANYGGIQLKGNGSLTVCAIMNSAVSAENAAINVKTGAIDISENGALLVRHTVNPGASASVGANTVRFQYADGAAVMAASSKREPVQTTGDNLIDFGYGLSEPEEDDAPAYVPAGQGWRQTGGQATIFTPDYGLVVSSPSAAEEKEYFGDPYRFDGGFCGIYSATNHTLGSNPGDFCRNYVYCDGNNRFATRWNYVGTDAFERPADGMNTFASEYQTMTGTAYTDPAYGWSADGRTYAAPLGGSYRFFADVYNTSGEASYAQFKRGAATVYPLSGMKNHRNMERSAALATEPGDPFEMKHSLTAGAKLTLALTGSAAVDASDLRAYFVSVSSGSDSILTDHSSLRNTGIYVGDTLVVSVPRGTTALTDAQRAAVKAASEAQDGYAAKGTYSVSADNGSNETGKTLAQAEQKLSSCIRLALTPDTVPVGSVSSVSGDEIASGMLSGFEFVGTQVRLAEPTGPRFIARISAAFLSALEAQGATEIRYGILLCRADALDGADLTMACVNGKSIAAGGATAAPANVIFANYGTYFYYTAAISGMPASAFTSPIVARPYVTYTAGGETFTYYATEPATAQYSVPGAAPVGGGYAASYLNIAEHICSGTAETPENKEWIRENIIEAIPSDPVPPAPPVSYPQADNISEYLVALTDQQNGKVKVLNLNAANPLTPVWTVETNTLCHVFGTTNGVDDAKIRNITSGQGCISGKVLIACSSSGFVSVIPYGTTATSTTASNTTARQFYLRKTGTWTESNRDTLGGAHSIEILPNGLVAVAISNSNGNGNGFLRIYRAASINDNTYAETVFPAAHGLSWDPDRNCLWVVGASFINSYYIGGSPTSTPTITLRSSAQITNDGSLHDLSPVYGSPDLLWTAKGPQVRQYSKTALSAKLYTSANQPTALWEPNGNGGYTAVSADKLPNTLYSVTWKNFPTLGLVAQNQRQVKSIGSFPDGTVVMTRAEQATYPNNVSGGNRTDEFNTDDIYVYRPDGHGGYTETVLHYGSYIYKARVLSTSYR